MANSTGSYRSTVVNFMAAYDKLPPTARAALANAAWCWAAQPLLTGWRNGYPGLRTGAEIAAKIACLDADETGKQALKTYGADHPQAAGARRLKTNRKKEGL
jgi:hypothetical protein